MIIYHIPKNLKTLIFDIDSTLYTNAEYVVAQTDLQIKHFAELRKLDRDTAKDMVSSYRDEWAKLNGGKQLSLGNAFKDLGVPIEESIAWRKKLCHPEDYLSYDAQLVESLTQLSGDYAMVCVTNNPVSVGRKTLEVLGVDTIIGEIIGLDTCRVSKPDRKMYELAAMRAGSPVEDCLSVGDRYDIDIALPLEMGMGGILIEHVSDIYTLKKMLDFSHTTNEK